MIPKKVFKYLMYGLLILILVGSDFVIGAFGHYSGSTGNDYSLGAFTDYMQNMTFEQFAPVLAVALVVIVLVEIILKKMR